LKKVTVRGFRRVSLTPLAGRVTILLTAVISIVGCVTVIGYAKACSRTTLASTTSMKISPIGQAALNKSESKVELEQYTPNSTVDKTVDNSESSGEWQTVRMRVTAYCPCPKCCGNYSDGKTACGHTICPGDAFVAADKKCPFGTEMIIDGYQNGKPVKVLDRGGAIRGNKLDVFFHTHNEALKWGVKYLDVKVHQK